MFHTRACMEHFVIHTHVFLFLIMETVLQTYQQLSTSFNSYQQVSTVINSYQQVSTVINSHQHCQQLPTAWKQSSNKTSTEYQQRTGTIFLQNIGIKSEILRISKTLYSCRQMAVARMPTLPHYNFIPGGRAKYSTDRGSTWALPDLPAFQQMPYPRW